MEKEYFEENEMQNNDTSNQKFSKIKKICRYLYQPMDSSYYETSNNNDSIKLSIGQSNNAGSDQDMVVEENRDYFKYNLNAKKNEFNSNSYQNYSQGYLTNISNLSNVDNFFSSSFSFPSSDSDFMSQLNFAYNDILSTGDFITRLKKNWDLFKNFVNQQMKNLQADSSSNSLDSSESKNHILNSEALNNDLHKINIGNLERNKKVNCESINENLRDFRSYIDTLMKRCENIHVMLSILKFKANEICARRKESIRKEGDFLLENKSIKNEMKKLKDQEKKINADLQEFTSKYNDLVIFKSKDCQNMIKDASNAIKEKEQNIMNLIKDGAITQDEYTKDIEDLIKLKSQEEECKIFLDSFDNQYRTDGSSITFHVSPNKPIASSHLTKSRIANKKNLRIARDGILKIAEKYEKLGVKLNRNFIENVIFLKKFTDFDNKVLENMNYDPDETNSGSDEFLKIHARLKEIKKKIKKCLSESKTMLSMAESQKSITLPLHNEANLATKYMKNVFLQLDLVVKNLNQIDSEFVHLASSISKVLN